MGLPARHYGPIPAKELEKWGLHYAKIKPLIIKDYIEGIPISEIMKKYKIGHQTFMPFVRKYIHKREANKLLRNKHNKHITKLP
jgi:DNA invertase Pin-like site-specific DNA recombinase